MAEDLKTRDDGAKIIIRAYVQNNSKGLIEQLEKNHIYLQKPEDLKKVLFSLFKLQPQLFKKILKNTAWDFTEPKTNSVQALQKMGLPGAEARTPEAGANAKEWWEQGVDLLIGSDESSTETTTTTTSAASGALTTKIVIGAVALLVLGGVVWLIIKSTGGQTT